MLAGAVSCEVVGILFSFLSGTSDYTGLISLLIAVVHLTS